MKPHTPTPLNPATTSSPIIAWDDNEPNGATLPNFDPIARPYRRLEYLTFGRALEHCRNHFLPQVLDRKHALALGDGDGRFFAALLAANPRLEADAVDTSASMLHLLARRAHASAPNVLTRLRTYHTSALTFAPQCQYDLVATHFFLDCLTQSDLEALSARIAPHLAPHALWIISDFRIPAGPMRWPARVLVRALYFAFRLLTGLRTTALPDHSTVLAAAGLTRIAHHHSVAGLLTTELWQFNSWPNSKPHQLQEYTPPMLPAQRPHFRAIDDPLPDPEPASPSLPGPDPGVFHHEPGECPAVDPDTPPPPAQ